MAEMLRSIFFLILECLNIVVFFISTVNSTSAKIGIELGSKWLGSAIAASPVFLTFPICLVCSWEKNLRAIAYILKCWSSSNKDRFVLCLQYCCGCQWPFGLGHWSTTENCALEFCLFIMCILKLAEDFICNIKVFLKYSYGGLGELDCCYIRYQYFCLSLKYLV